MLLRDFRSGTLPETEYCFASEPHRSKQGTEGAGCMIECESLEA